MGGPDPNLLAGDRPGDITRVGLFLITSGRAEEAKSWLARLPEALRKRYAEAPDFWDGAALAEFFAAEKFPPAAWRLKLQPSTRSPARTSSILIMRGYRRAASALMFL